MTHRNSFSLTEYTKQYSKRILFLTTLMLVLFSTELHASEQVENTSIFSALDVLSVSPSTAEQTTLEASGKWRNGCIPVLDSVEFVPAAQENSVLRIMAVAEPIDFTCGQLETSWNFPVDVHFDLPGSYTVEFFIISEQLDTVELHASKEIVVEEHLGFSPTLPHADAPVTLTVTGIQPDGCIPEYVSHEMVESTIVVELMTPDSDLMVCGQALTPWKIELDIDQLTDGEYVVDVYSSEQHQGVATGRTLHKNGTLSVGPNGAQAVEHFIYLPNVISQ